ncbi:hypothetical protein [Meridianimarinicoccus aquatilis]|uniref:hypothetical protein n=1 Tax=Meridianimarinicoccus aquatilis TaxID=2552766 RepID=UPI001404B214|nr:hypothetical protein [Fluviibacterium aquatile]
MRPAYRHLGRPFFRATVLCIMALLAGCTQDQNMNLAQGAGLGAISGLAVGGVPGALAGTAVGAAFGFIATPANQP